MKLRRWHKLLLGLTALLLLPWLALVVAACFTDLPAALSNGQKRSTVLVLDRDGRLLREVQVGSAAVHNPVQLSELSPWVVPALVAAEDARFFSHPGVDPLAVSRALGQWLWERRLVSGASTLTQQLARTLEARPRTVRGKLREMTLALRIEASLSKEQILEQYLSRVEFGPNLIGVEAASRHYFRKPARALDLSEAAALMGLPRGPSLYDPRRRPQLFERRRLRVLARMERLGLITPAELTRAELTPMKLAEPLVARGAEHVSFALALRHGGGVERARALRTTLAGDLQREAESIARAAVSELERHDGSALSLLVLDNASGDVLAYVGSPGYFDSERSGANDGVTARRQPGSALKPFLYAAAMRDLGYGAATLLPDLPRAFTTASGSFNPRNYDQRFRGPVLLRQALGSSLNLPALEVSSRLGPERLLRTLHDFGFASLDRDAEHYGVGLALGDGEVTLLEVTRAYAALARGGELTPARLLLEQAEPGASRRVLEPELAALITDILADDAARAAGFGRDSVLALPFPVAAKTGTSKGFRDNWAVGYTREVTVGVWVGNFDGSPLRDASGVTVAGPVFRRLMLAAMRGRSPVPLYDESLLGSTEVCALSGQAPGDACPHRRREKVARGGLPAERCDLHVRVQCAGGERVLERYGGEYLAWARAAGRPIVERAVGCGVVAAASGAPRVTFPREHQRFVIDPDGPARQEIVLAAEASAKTVRFELDGRPSAELRPPFRLPWRLTPGEHRVEVVADGRRSAVTTFSVR